MLGTLQLEKFRGFETYALTDLTRVNLLVGKNNCGKTSILEAIHFLVSGGDPFVLTGTANRRGEVSDTGATARGWRPDVSHFFFGHRLEPGRPFVFLATATRRSQLRLALLRPPTTTGLNTAMTIRSAPSRSFCVWSETRKRAFFRSGKTDP